MLSPTYGGSQFGSSQLATAFQNAYTNSLLGKNSLGTSSSLATIALGTAQSPGLNSVIPGSNPIAPLAGVPALQGLDQFVSSIETTAAQRKAGLLDEPSSGGGGGLSDLLGPLMGMLGGDDSGLGAITEMLSGGTPGKGDSSDILDALDPDVINEFLAGQSEEDISFDRSSKTSRGKTSIARDEEDGSDLMAQLQAMMGQLQSLFSNLGGDPSQIPGGGGFTQNGPVPGQQQVPPGGVPTPTGNQLAQTTAQVQPGQRIYTSGLNFNVIDQAINNTLGSISATLPLVNI